MPSRPPPIRPKWAFVDLVQISVKGYHTASAAKMCVPMVGPDTYVLSVQNGLKNLQRIAEIGGPREGHRRRDGAQRHAFEPHLDQVQRRRGWHLHRSVRRARRSRRGATGRRCSTPSGFETHLIHGDVRIPLWRKLLANISCNAVAALTGFTGRQLVEFEPTNELIRALAEETAEVARAQGFEFAELEHRRRFRHPRAVRSGRQQDLHAAGYRGGAAHRDRHAQPGRGGAGRGVRRRHSPQLGDRHT